MEQLVHNLLSLAIAAVNMAIVIRSLDRVASWYLKMFTFSSFLLVMVMSALVLFMQFTMIFDFHAEFQPVSPCSFIESVGEVLQFTADSMHEANVISESQVGDRSATNGDGCVGVLEVVLNYLLKTLG